MVKPRLRADGLWAWLTPIVLASVVLLALTVINEFSVVPARERSQAQVRHTLEVIAAAREFDEAVQQAERTQRGYVITGDPAYLAACREAVAKAPSALARLRRLAADNPAQQQRMDRLGRLLDSRLRSLVETAGIFRTSGFDAARQRILQLHPLRQMAEVATLIRSVLQEENRLLLERQARDAAIQRQDSQQNAAASILAAGILLLGGIPLLLRRLRGAEATLHESEQRFGLLVGSIRDYAILLLDADGRILTWNEGAAIMTGYDAAEVIGRHVALLFTEEDVAAGMVERDLRSVLEGDGRTEAEGWRRRKDGTRFWVNSVRSVVRNQAGRGIGVTVVLRDMTRQRQEQEAMERRRAALEQAQKLETLGQLTGGVAHDFNNLLTVIMQSIESLQMRIGGPGNEDAVRLLATAERAAARGAGLTRRLLAFARRQPLEPRRTNVSDLVGNMSELLARTLGSAVTVQTRLAPGLPDVLVDPNQLENALLNLAINA
ncbi:MAG: CHASE3 domain-containing protein, partial [Rhodospirillales bacterium]|nr:CHASE3 domain-containing protein [Rhodospirillales bacterium]